MASGTSRVDRPRLRWSLRRTAALALAVTASVAGLVVATAGTASAAAGGGTGGAPCISVAATFSTEIQWGGPDAPWHPDQDLTLLINNRRSVVVGSGGIANGTQVSWAGPNGNANIVFGGSDFSGSAQFPNEGPVGYRGTLRSTDGREVLCGRIARFTTEIQWGGFDAPWHPDEDLTLLISNRQPVVAPDTAPVGTQVSWSSPNGNASITMFGDGYFSGSAQFPNEGPVGYRGTLG